MRTSLVVAMVILMAASASAQSGPTDVPRFKTYSGEVCESLEISLTQCLTLYLNRNDRCLWARRVTVVTGTTDVRSDEMTPYLYNGAQVCVD
jgi:hypothetical protein